MKEKTLIIISFTGAVICLIALFILINTQNFRDQKDNLELEGIAEQTSQSSGVTFLEIRPTSTITAVFYDNIDVELGKKIKLKGELKRYKNNIEFVATEISKI